MWAIKRPRGFCVSFAKGEIKPEAEHFLFPSRFSVRLILWHGEKVREGRRKTKVRFVPLLSRKWAEKERKEAFFLGLS